MAPNIWEHCNKSTPKSTMFKTPTLSPLGSLLQSGFVKREAWECVVGFRVTGCSGVTRGQLLCAESLNSPEPIPMAQSGTIWYITLHSWPQNYFQHAHITPFFCFSSGLAHCWLQLLLPVAQRFFSLLILFLCRIVYVQKIGNVRPTMSKYFSTVCLCTSIVCFPSFLHWLGFASLHQHCSSWVKLWMDLILNETYSTWYHLRSGGNI